eukprot:11185822-Lingulodinium_polyedra.AAC.1
MAARAARNLLGCAVEAPRQGPADANDEVLERDRGWPAGPHVPTRRRHAPLPQRGRLTRRAPGGGDRRR